jgi:hypothetical protein
MADLRWSPASGWRVRELFRSPTPRSGTSPHPTGSEEPWRIAAEALPLLGRQNVPKFLPDRVHDGAKLRQGLFQYGVGAWPPALQDICDLSTLLRAQVQAFQRRRQKPPAGARWSKRWWLGSPLEDRAIAGHAGQHSHEERHREEDGPLYPYAPERLDALLH